MNSDLDAFAHRIGPGSAPVASPRVASVEVDGEAVLYDEATGSLHRLNPSATLVWSALDGQATLRELAGDIAAAAGADPSVVEADVVAAARDFGRLGLLDDPGDPEEGAGEGESPASSKAALTAEDAIGGSPRTVPVPGST